MEISDFVDLNANVFWDDQKVMSQIQKLEKYWHETDKNFSRSGNRDSLSPTLRAQILEHNPSFFHLEAVMTKKWSGEGSTDSISSDEDRRAKRRRYDGSTVKRRREDDWDACMNNIVDKLITKKPASQKTAWDIVSLLEERLEQAHKDLRDAQARLAQEEMQLMQLMQEKFDLMLRVQLLEESQRRCNCSSSS
ncbi:hypothetical protein DFQ27_000010 [Actinomortierella ambigua]|uniref:Uncharacterized protein n=1 Tax=Actinomortierella ambigua TaxID=1343610 RepID=A0A9P6QJY3_9FUNG|nr:hypothetical protein DFQ27_000010 [Actinomortierella ambigua]